ncbi:MAG: DinB family protein [Candidatus Thorarchaeota archaeon]
MPENIKDVFELLVKYNTMTNKEAVDVLEKLEPSKLTEDLGSYFGSILGLLDHQLVSDIGWLRALGENVPELDFVLPLIEEYNIERIPPKELHWKTLSEYSPVRGEVDKVLERVITTLSPDQYSASITLKGRRGEFTYITWRILLHLFNHHTHHRGGVSTLLDQLNIESNFSNLLWRV